MYAPVSTSNPYLAIARHHGVTYSIVLLLAEWLSNGSPTYPGPDDPRRARHYWWFWMRRELHNLPSALSSQVQNDVVETMHRLNGVNVRA